MTRGMKRTGAGGAEDALPKRAREGTENEVDGGDIGATGEAGDDAGAAVEAAEIAEAVRVPVVAKEEVLAFRNACKSMESSDLAMSMLAKY